MPGCGFARGEYKWKIVLRKAIHFGVIILVCNLSIIFVSKEMNCDFTKTSASWYFCWRDHIKVYQSSMGMIPLELNVFRRHPTADGLTVKARGMRPIFQSSEGSDTKKKWKLFVQLIFRNLDWILWFWLILNWYWRFSWPLMSFSMFGCLCRVGA